MPGPVPRTAFAVFAACLLLACGRESAPPRWIALARGFRPLPLTGPAVSVDRRTQLECYEGGSDVLIRVELESSDWEELGSGLWRARRPVPMVGVRDFKRNRNRLEIDGRPVRLSPDAAAIRGAFLSAVPGPVHPELLDRLQKRRPEAVFAPIRGWVIYFDPETRRPPEEAILFDVLSRGEDIDGHWRVTFGNVLTDGIPVLPGQTEQLRAQAPPGGAVLRLATTTQGDGDGKLLFRVLLNDELLLEHEQSIAEKGHSDWHAIPIEVPGDGELAFTFEVEGELAMAAFLDPTIGPAEGVVRSQARPDIVVFLADTFRADNLAAHGGDPVWTPVLNDFVRECVVFDEAHAPASWTLPSHAAMFSGLHPYQVGVQGRTDRLPDQAQTIAEHLSENGYRTIAVTERGFVSRAFGMAQGFHWFEEAIQPLERTLDCVEALLEARDERPLFLFVHTFRTHGPYQVSDRTRQRLGMEPESELRWDSVFPDMRAYGEELAARTLTRRASAEAEAVVRRVHALYRGGAADLDLGFDRFLGMLRDKGVLPGGFLVFTSDHGECFWEHGDQGHGRGVWEENLHVPFLVHGPGLVPGTVAMPVGLVELPGAICRMAGVDSGPFQTGYDLLEREDARPVLSFECQIARDRVLLALQLDLAKVIAIPPETEGDVGVGLHAYDLARDPLEQSDESEAPWATLLMMKLWPTASHALEPLLLGEEASPDAAQLERLRGLGYVGDEQK